MVLYIDPDPRPLLSAVNMPQYKQQDVTPPHQARFAQQNLGHR
jgi:hypothetical protein